MIPLTTIREELHANDIRPEWQHDGIPSCSSEECPCYDGKRCRALGFKPESMCEPAVSAMVDALTGKGKAETPAIPGGWAEVEECDGCHFGPVLATEATRPPLRRGEHPAPVKICEVCFNTYLGTLCQYPGRSNEPATMETIAITTNMILAEIRRARCG